MLANETIRQSIVKGDIKDISSICDKLREGNRRVQQKLHVQKQKAEEKKKQLAEQAQAQAVVEREINLLEQNFTFDEKLISAKLDKNIQKVGAPVQRQIFMENCFDTSLFESELKTSDTRLANLYTKDVQINKRNVENLNYEFIDRKLEESLTQFMTNILFGDAMCNVAKMQAKYAEDALGKCLGKEEENEENDEELADEEEDEILNEAKVVNRSVNISGDIINKSKKPRNHSKMAATTKSVQKKQKKPAVEPTKSPKKKIRSTTK